MQKATNIYYSIFEEFEFSSKLEIFSNKKLYHIVLKHEAISSK